MTVPIWDSSSRILHQPFLEVTLNILVNKLLDELYHFLFHFQKETRDSLRECRAERRELLLCMRKSLVRITLVRNSFIVHLRNNPRMFYCTVSKSHMEFEQSNMCAHNRSIKHYHRVCKLTHKQVLCTPMFIIHSKSRKLHCSAETLFRCVSSKTILVRVQKDDVEESISTWIWVNDKIVEKKKKVPPPIYCKCTTMMQ